MLIPTLFTIVKMWNQHKHKDMSVLIVYFVDLTQDESSGKREPKVRNAT